MWNPENKENEFDSTIMDPPHFAESSGDDWFPPSELRANNHSKENSLGDVNENGDVTKSNYHINEKDQVDTPFVSRLASLKLSDSSQSSLGHNRLMPESKASLKAELDHVSQNHNASNSRRSSDLSLHFKKTALQDKGHPQSLVRAPSSSYEEPETIKGEPAADDIHDKEDGTNKKSTVSTTRDVLDTASTRSNTTATALSLSKAGEKLNPVSIQRRVITPEYPASSFSSDPFPDTLGVSQDTFEHTSHHDSDHDTELDIPDTAPTIPVSSPLDDVEPQTGFPPMSSMPMPTAMSPKPDQGDSKKPFYLYNEKDRESMTAKDSSESQNNTIGVREEKDKIDNYKSIIFALQIKIHILLERNKGSLPTNILDLQKQLAEERAWRLTAEHEVKRLNAALSKLREAKECETDENGRFHVLQQPFPGNGHDYHEIQHIIDQYNDALEELTKVQDELLDVKDVLARVEEENLLLNQTLQESYRVSDNLAVEDLLHKLNLENESLLRSLDNGQPRFASTSALARKRSLFVERLLDIIELLGCDVDDNFRLETGSDDTKVLLSTIDLAQNAVLIRMREFDDLAQEFESLKNEKNQLEKDRQKLCGELEYVEGKRKEAVSLTRQVTERCEVLQKKLEEAVDSDSALQTIDAVVDVVRQFYQRRVDDTNVAAVSEYEWANIVVYLEIS